MFDVVVKRGGVEIRRARAGDAAQCEESAPVSRDCGGSKSGVSQRSATVEWNGRITVVENSRAASHYRCRAAGRNLIQRDAASAIIEQSATGADLVTVCEGERRAACVVVATGAGASGDASGLGSRVDHRERGGSRRSDDVEVVI